jgi:DinB superfamily
MAINPYAPQLGEHDPLAVTRATPARLQSLIAALGTDKLNAAPAPGKWSVRDILCHLADCEVVFAFRLRQALAQDHHVIQPFDQDDWAATYARYDAQTALATFSAIRQWNLALIAGLAPVDLDKRLNHPERGDMTLRVVIETMGGHDLNHLRQVEAILS